MKKCIYCGKELRDTAKFCDSCGAPCEAAQQRNAQQPNGQSYQQGNMQQPYGQPLQQANMQQSYGQPLQQGNMQQSYGQPLQQRNMQQSYGQQVQNGRPNKKKSAAPLIAVLIGVLLIAIALLVAVILWKADSQDSKQDSVGISETTEVGAEEQEQTEEMSEEVSEEMTEAPTQEVDESYWETEISKAKRNNAYGDVLAMFSGIDKLPDVETEGYTGMGYEDRGQNTFAIADVDQDGHDELILQITETCMAGMMLKIYDMDEDKYGQEDMMICELTEYPSIHVYDNGVIIADQSHNQTPGETIWPYMLHSYDAATDTYLYKGNVSCWDKSLTETYGGEDFPADMDTDGDGTVYYVAADGMKGDNGEEYVIMDNAEYQEWYDSYLNGASEIELDFQKLDDFDYYQYGSAYIDTYMEYHDALNPEESGTDIGRIMLESMDYETITKTMEKAGVEIETGEEVDTGVLDGEEVYVYSCSDIGSFTYKSKQVGDITVLGIYPGMDDKEALERLVSYGFYEETFDYGDSNYHYITGDGFGNMRVTIEQKGGKVTQIWMRPHCGYAG